MQNSSNEEAVRERAYRLWEAGGRCEGCDEYYWYLAVELLQEEAVFSKKMSETIARLSEPGRRTISEDSGNDRLGPPDALSDASCRQPKIAAD